MLHFRPPIAPNNLAAANQFHGAAHPPVFNAWTNQGVRPPAAPVAGIAPHNLNRGPNTYLVPLNYGNPAAAAANESALAPPVLIGQLGRQTNATGAFIAGQPSVTPAYLMTAFLGLPVNAGPHRSGNLSLLVQNWGLQRLTLTIPEAKLNSMVLSLTNPAFVPLTPLRENAELLAATLTCLMVNGFDPRRAPMKRAVNEEYPLAYNGLPGAGGDYSLPMAWPGGNPHLILDGRPTTGQIPVPFLNANSSYPNEGPRHTPLSLQNMINHPTAESLMDVQFIIMMQAPAKVRHQVRPVPIGTRNNGPIVAAAIAHNLLHAAHIAAGTEFIVPRPIGGDRVGSMIPIDHNDPTRRTIVIDKQQENDSHALATPMHYVRVKRKNHPAYLKATWRACKNSVVRLREKMSGTNADPRYMTVGRIHIWFWDLQQQYRLPGVPGARYGPINMHLERGIRPGDVLPLGPVIVGCGSRSKTTTKKMTNPHDANSMIILQDAAGEPAMNNCLFNNIRLARKQMKAKQLKIHGVCTAWFEEDDVLKDGQDGGAENSLIRFSLGIEPRVPIDVLDSVLLQKVAFLMRTNIRIFSKQLDLITNVDVAGARITADLLYVEPTEDQSCGHVMLLEQTKNNSERCGLCGMLYYVKHVCNANRVRFMKAKTKRKQDPDIIADVQPDKDYTANNWKFDYAGPHIVYFDLETFQKSVTDEITNDDLLQHTPYSCGIWNEVYQLFVGETCLDQFLEHLQQVDGARLSFKGKKEQDQLQSVYLVAWNGAKYDFKLLLNHILCSDLWKTCITVVNVVNSNNRILSMSFKFHEREQYYTCFDPCLWLISSLDKACKDFGIEGSLAKTFFPHKLITDYHLLDVRLGLEDFNEPLYYFPADQEKLKNDSWTAEKFSSLGLLADVQGNYSLRELHDNYLERDVMGMKAVCQSFFTDLDAEFEATSIKFLTISQFTFCQFLKHSEHKGSIYVPQSDAEYLYMRSAVYGGRVYPATRMFQSEQADMDYILGLGWEEGEYADGQKFDCPPGVTFETFVDNVREKDVTSLYPAAMKYNDFPIGRHRLMTSEEISQINEYILNSIGRECNLGYGIYSVDYVPNNTLLHPVLPRRVNNGLIWDLVPGRGEYTSIELEMAVLCHYKIKVTAGYIWDRHAPVFQKIIDMTYKLKETNSGPDGNKSKRQAGKLMLNALYGKMLQKLQNGNSSVLHCREDFNKFASKNDVETIVVLSPQVVLVTGTKLEVSYTKPYHLGAFVLSYSRRIMFRNLIKFSPTTTLRPSSFTSDMLLRDIAETYFYTDTDCMYVRSGSREMHEGDHLGGLKDESLSAGGGIIFYGLWLSKKVYGYFQINRQNQISLKLCCKGISRAFLVFKDYMKVMKDPLYQSLKTNNNAIKTYGLDKHAFGIFNVTTTRTFNKTQFCSRLGINVHTGEIDHASPYTIPHGHCLDTFRHGEYWWLRYQQSGTSSGFSPSTWVEITRTEEEVMAESFSDQAAECKRQRLEESEDISARYDDDFFDLDDIVM